MSSFKSKLRLICAFAALAALALAVSCRGFFVSPTLTSLAIGPTTVSLSPSQTYQMTATGTFDDGSQRTVTNQAVWSSSDPGTASIGQNSGLVTAASTATTIGTTTISASDGAITATTTATVNVCPIISDLTLTAPQGTSGPAGSDTLTVGATATVGSTPGTPVAELVTWNIADSTVLTITTFSPSVSTVTLQSGSDAASTTVSATLCGVTSTNTLTFTINNFTGN